MKHFALNVALLFLFGFLVIALRYTGGKGFGVISGEDENGWFGFRNTHESMESGKTRN